MNDINQISFLRKISKQPQLDFMISNDEFFINTHGVSVTEIDKSYNKSDDGEFFILNKNNKPLYFNGLYPGSIKIRNDNLYSSNLIKILLDSTFTDINNDINEKYIVLFKNNEIGSLNIKRLLLYENGNNTLINPFQSLKFIATYAVSNINKLDLHYYGKSSIRTDIMKGIIDINFIIKCFSDKDLTNNITDTITFTVCPINSGYTIT